ncbi:MAG: molybdopterin-dependent oxidoreductase [Pseudomonadota bacterium]
MGTHWGLYRHAPGGALSPFEGDPAPAALGLPLPEDRLAPCRILRPAVRRSFLELGPGHGRRGAEPFVEVSWDEALDLAASEIRRVRDVHGSTALYSGSYGWSSAGRFHHAQSQLKRFYNCIGGSVRSVQSYSYAAAEVVLPHVIGTLDGLVTGHTPWDELVGHAELIVMFGGAPLRNAQVSAGGIARHETKAGLIACRDTGAAFINVSPVKDDAAAALEAEWVALRPTTDTALLLALSHVLVTEGLHDADFLACYTTGFETFRAYLTGETDGVPKSPGWAADITGIAAERIVALARRMAGRRTFLMMAWALQRAEHGEQPYWAAIALASLLGGIGLPGRGIGFGYASVGGVGTTPAAINWPALPQGKNPVSDAIPVARIADMLLHPGAPYRHDGITKSYPHIRLVHWAGGNPFHHHQDLNRLVDAWQRPETIIVHEHWWNAHARHADIVLPAATFLERDDLVASGRDRFIAYSQALAAPPPEVRTDFDMLAGLAHRLGVEQAFSEGRDAAGWLRHLYAQTAAVAGSKGITLPDFEVFRAAGMAEVPARAGPNALFAPFRADPKAHPLNTPSGRIELFSQRVAGFGQLDCPGYPAWLPPVEWLGGPLAARFPLHLLSCQPADKLHSQWDHASPSRATKARGRQPLRMHPSDMGRRGLRDGDLVEVTSPRGRCLAIAEQSDGLLAGVVQMATGAWFDPMEPGVPGSLECNGNPNVLTQDRGTSSLAQGPSANSCLVEVRRFEGLPPPVRAYDPPVFVPRRPFSSPCPSEALNVEDQ